VKYIPFVYGKQDNYLAGHILQQAACSGHLKKKPTANRPPPAA
jgi:hypothetical protein